jgi:hypothetical protein
VRILENNEVAILKKNYREQSLVFALCMLIFSFLLGIEYVIANNIILDIMKIFPDTPSVIAGIVTPLYIQFVNIGINQNFLKIVASLFDDEFYLIPFQILAVVNIIKYFFIFFL